MLEDKYNILNIIRENHGVLPLDNIADLLIEGFKSELMSDKDKNLINMIFSSNPTQEKLDTFLEKWDIEAVGSAKALMLAYFMKMHPELNFSEYVGPRLNGLLRFYKFQNMKNSKFFNPADIVCGVRDFNGNKFDLTKYVDEQTGFISTKSKNGVDMKVLELPGLWNGAMSNWNTIFVEVPIDTFNPVKSVNDLLREQHR